MTRTPSAALAAALALAGASCAGRHDPHLIVASGHVEATDVRLSTKVPGRLVSFAVHEGDSVKTGQELAKLDTIDLELALDQARAERQQARAELRLRQTGARPEDIAELSAQTASVEADLAGAQRDLERMQALFDKGSGTTKARDDAKTRRDMAAARLAAIRESLARIKAGFREEEKDAARARVAAVEAKLAQLEQQVKDATVTSPLNGVVTEKIAEPGELLQPGAALCVVTDLTNAWLTVYVGEPDLGRIRIGQEADVVTDGGEVRKGKLSFIASKAEFTPRNVQTRDERVKLVYRVKVLLPNSDGLFKPGMPAEARFAVEAAK
jgi:HlyD family secretion protein